MALRNAFEGLATASKQDGIISLLRALVRSTTYARTSEDRMYVAGTVGISTTGFNNTATQWGNGNSNPFWYGTGSPNSMDAREQQMLTSQVNIAQTMQRWTVT